MKIGIYPGSFDPVTSGHLDLIERASHLVDKLIVAVLFNQSKGKGLFSVEERIDMLEKTTAHLPNVAVDSFSGLLVDYVKNQKANVIVRGLRTALDFENEMQMAQINKQLLTDVETVFLVTAPQYAFVSSSSVRELAYFKGAYGMFVPKYVEEKLKNK